MNKVKIITDSCADLNGEQLKKYGIDYAKMTTVRNGIESEALLDRGYDGVRELYDAMRKGERITTAQVSITEFERVFEGYLESGYDIVYIGCSSKQSGSVNTAYTVARRLREKYPDRNVICIDSLNASMGEGMLAIEAAKMAERGMSADWIEAQILDIRNKVNQFVTVHTLDHLCRAGRVKASAAFFGNLMGVKPIIISDAEGQQMAFKKVKGRSGALKALVSLMKERIISPENQVIYLTHADCAIEEVERLIALIKSEIPCLDVEVGYIGPIIGASIGPDAIGIWGFGVEKK